MRGMGRCGCRFSIRTHVSKWFCDDKHANKICALKKKDMSYPASNPTISLLHTVLDRWNGRKNGDGFFTHFGGSFLYWQVMIKGILPDMSSLNWDLQNFRPWCHMVENHWPGITTALLRPMSVHSTKVDSSSYIHSFENCLNSTWVTVSISAGPLHRKTCISDVQNHAEQNKNWLPCWEKLKKQSFTDKPRLPDSWAQCARATGQELNVISQL